MSAQPLPRWELRDDLPLERHPDFALIAAPQQHLDFDREQDSSPTSRMSGTGEGPLPADLEQQQ